MKIKILERFKKHFYKDGTNTLDYTSVISSAIMVAALLIFIPYKNADLKNKAIDRKKHLRYTIATTGKIRSNFRSPQPVVHYEYTFLNEQYRGRQHVGAKFEGSVRSNGGRYFLEISSKNPGNSRLLLGYPVPDSLRAAPANGWAKVPGYDSMP